jgi:hypothetical protein
MDDNDVIANISALVEEEHALAHELEGRSVTAEDKARLQKLEVALDQCWDLLRQRRARRQYGDDPEAARGRDESTVEGYWQ